jgi:uncharacterized protein YggE
MAKTEVNLYLSKQYLAFVIAILAFVFLFVGYVTWSATGARQSLITVSASGSLSANPAQATISLFLNATGSSSASAVSNLSAITGKLNATLTPFIKGNSSMIQTLSYNVYPTTNCTNFPTPYPVYPTTTIYCTSPRKFYIASEYLLVTIPDASNADPALLGLSAINGVNVNNVAAQLSTQQQASLSQQALTLALSNATSQAQALAGSRQISVMNITVQNSNIYYPVSGVFAAARASSNQTFFPGRATVTKSVYVVFSMH